MSNASQAFTGILGSLTQGIKDKKAQDRERANMILKAVLEGNATQNVPQQGVGQKIMGALGIGTPPEADMRNVTVQPSPQRQLQSENLKYMQNINSQMAGGGDTGNLIYRDVTGKEISPEVAQADISKGNTNYSIFKRDISKGGVKETSISKPEDLEKSRAVDNKSQLILDQANDSLKTIAEVKKGIGYFGPGSLIPAIPGAQPDKVNWQSNLETLLSKKMIDLMTQMKEASKTGATGFGQLSEKEGAILMNASTALRKTMSPQDALRYLDDMESALKKITTKNDTQSTSYSGGAESTTPSQEAKPKSRFRIEQVQ